MTELTPMEIIWRPTPEVAARARIGRFMAKHGFASLEALHRRSIEDPEWFWDAVSKDIGLAWIAPYRRVLDEARVQRFQHDPECRLFLVSLKAGGLGLNLTAAEHVFLLDPWWNPAVEAQAIDRAHRIGKERHVFAYRLIAKDTVEERVLELQQRKRRLADAILMADGSLLRELRREDLELLLS